MTWLNQWIIFWADNKNWTIFAYSEMEVFGTFHSKKKEYRITIFFEMLLLFARQSDRPLRRHRGYVPTRCGKMLGTNPDQGTKVLLLCLHCLTSEYTRPLYLRKTRSPQWKFDQVEMLVSKIDQEEAFIWKND